MESITPGEYDYRMAVRKLVTGLKKRDKDMVERRMHRRYTVDIQIELHTKSSFGKYTLLCESWLMDVSYGGMGCLVQIHLEPRTVVYVSFKTIVGKDCYVAATVSHCRPMFGGIHMLHTSFVFNQS